MFFLSSLDFKAMFSSTHSTSSYIFISVQLVWSRRVTADLDIKVIGTFMG